MPVQYKVIQELVILVALDFRKSLKENVYLLNIRITYEAFKTRDAQGSSQIN